MRISDWSSDVCSSDLYVGPVDGHNLDHLLPVLENVRDATEGPILVHVVTKKGKGYAQAEAADDKYHGVVKFDVITGTQAKAPSGPLSYTKVFAQALVDEPTLDDQIVAIPTVMPSGPGSMDEHQSDTKQVLRTSN